jgi:hypothetical protein
VVPDLKQVEVDAILTNTHFSDSIFMIPDAKQAVMRQIAG